jgi:peptidylprolyl isomerase
MTVNRGPAGKSSARNDQRMKTVAVIVAAALLLSLAAYLLVYRGSSQAQQVTTPSGLKYTDVVEGTGPVPKKGQTLSVQYTGTLQNGTKFDSSYDHGKPFDFKFGIDPMIKGWDEGVATMKVGGKRKLIVPPGLGYGAQGKPGIPPNSILLFEIELLSAK